MATTNCKFWLLIGTVAGGGLLSLLVPAIQQDPAYHQFADQRTILGFPNFANVLSNLPLLLTGFSGVCLLLKKFPAGGLPELRSNYLFFFVGLILTSLGSSYYHLQPDNASLACDRLAMVIAFMAFLSCVIGEQVDVSIGQRLLWPLILAGLFSVGYWYWSELQEAGDLRWYALVQFLPLLLITAMLLLFHSPFSGHQWIWLILAAYLAAKLTELADREIFQWLEFISGHSLKHLLAALAGFIFLLALHIRRPKKPTETY